MIPTSAGDSLVNCKFQETWSERFMFFPSRAWIPFVVASLLCGVNMKKTWVKRENIYYIPFYKQRTKMLLLCTILLGIVFFLYQVRSIRYLTIASTPWSLGSPKHRRKWDSNVASEKPASNEINILRWSFGYRCFEVIFHAILILMFLCRIAEVYDSLISTCTNQTLTATSGAWMGVGKYPFPS